MTNEKPEVWNDHKIIYLQPIKEADYSDGRLWCQDEVWQGNGVKYTRANEWQPIDTAPKEKDDTGLSPRIMLGFAPDEEDYTLPSCEGYWRNSEKPGWVSCMDPDVPNPYSQPTHWMPLPEPPKSP